MRKLLLFALLGISLGTQAQLGGLLKKVGGKKSNSEAAASKMHQTDGVTSPMHQKYMNKIIFASKDADIKKGEENEAGFITKATLGNPIVFRVYLDNSLSNYCIKMHPGENTGTIEVQSLYQVKWYLDGAEAGTSIIDEKQFEANDKNTWTTFRGALKSADGKYSIGTNIFADFVKENEPKLTMGEHKIKMELLPFIRSQSDKLGPVMATGELTLVVSKNIIDPNDPNVCMPKAEMTDKALEAKIAAAFRRNKTYGGEPASIRIISPKFEIVTNKYSGRVLRRYVAVAIAVSENGKCTYRKFEASQDFDGLKYQDEMSVEPYLMNVQDINCGCLKTK